MVAYGVVEASRAAWRTKLYGFLDDADYEALADGPLAGAMAAYRRTEGRTTAVVWVVVFVMLAAAAMEAGWINPDALRS
jgi:maltooligosyltrehalose synthase